MKSLWKLIKRLLGFPPDPRPEQVGEHLITMREARDCHCAMVGTLLKISYEQASRALKHWNLPFFFESPVISNPLNVKRAIMSLGWAVREIDWTELNTSDDLVPGKVAVLVHCPDSEIAGTLKQHWVVWFGRDSDGAHLLHWGIDQWFVTKPEGEMWALFRTSWPNCAFTVRKP